MQLKKIGDPIVHAETVAQHSEHSYYLCKLNPNFFFVSMIWQATKEQLEELVNLHQPKNPPVPNSSDGKTYFFVYYERDMARITVPLHEVVEIRQIIP